jgi:hypothetical protein
MSCPYFTTVHDTGLCNASSGSYIPGLDEMGSLCFKDVYHECTHFSNDITESSMPQINKRPPSQLIFMR